VVTGISVTKPAGVTSAMVTISANVRNAAGTSTNTNTCTLAIQGPGQSDVTTSDTYSAITAPINGGATVSVSRTFFLTGLATASSSWTLYYKGSTSGSSRSCTISEVSFVVLTP
jgi:hypothetical protein